MPIFTNQYQPALLPYYSDPTNDPLYRQDYARLKRNHGWATAGYTAGKIGAGFLSLIPFVGPALAAGAEAGLTVAENASDKKYQSNQSDLMSRFKTMDHSTRGSVPGESNLGDLGSILSKNTYDGFNQMFKTLKDKNTENSLLDSRQNFLNQMDSTGTEGNNASGLEGPSSGSPPMVGGDVGGGKFYDFGENSGGGGGADMGGGGDVGMKEGGMIKYAGGGLLKPMGEDDIALVDTKNGKDTGVRVQEGEMLVVSKDKLESLHEALKKGDHKGVFNIMKAQVKQAPKVKDSKTGFAKGGTGSTENSTDKTPKLINEMSLSEIDELLAKEEKEFKDGVYPVEGNKRLDKDGAAQRLSGLRIMRDRVSKGQPAFDPNYGLGDTGGEAYISPFFGLRKDSLKPESEKIIPQETKQEEDKVDVVTPNQDEQGQSNAFELFKKRFSNLNNEGQNPPVEYPSMAPQDKDFSGVGIDRPDYAIPINEPDEAPGRSGSFGRYAKYYAPEILGTGFDIARGVMGFNAANRKLPTFSKPQAWNDYLNRLHGLSETGLTGNELTAAQRNIDQTYASDIANIRNFSGGNSGMLLGNLGRAANSHYAANTNLSALDDEARARNLAQYGGALTEDVNLNRMIFGDKYNEALWTKQAGSQLANDAIKNIGERFQTDREFGPGSYYDKINQLNLGQAEDTNDNTKAMLKYYSLHGFKKPQIGSYSGGGIPNYNDYLEYKNWIKGQQ